ncbi:MAG: DNA polymerase IV [Epulopiscium sp.]|nr:DNA polymerase IV [Candidatus Epulonipiscium sp.]
MRSEILHIDMDSFYASCEQVRNPKLRNQPIVVGGDPKTRRGIVLAASYEARQQGIYTTMPLWEALKKCPNVTIVRPDHDYYEFLSLQVMMLLDEYTPLKEQMSIDEAFLDMTGSERIFGKPYQIASSIQQKILNEVGLPCSIGISSNKILAKMGSGMNKPFGLTVLYPEDVPEMLWPLPISKLYGVGRKQRKLLENYQIDTIGDLAKYPIQNLASIVGQKVALQLHDYANGKDRAPVKPNHPQDVKSISNENTFSEDLLDLAQIKKELLMLTEKVAWRLRKIETEGRTVFIKIKYYNFVTVIRNRTLPRATNVTDVFYQQALDLFLQHWNKSPIRLLGVGIANLETEECEQISLWDIKDEQLEKKKKVDHVVDVLREKYGYGVMQRATTIQDSKK